MMTPKRLLVLLLAGVVLVGGGRRAAAADGPAMYSLAERMALPIDVLEAGLERMRTLAAEYKPMGVNTAVEARYLIDLRTAIENTRAALAAKGTPAPPVPMPPIPGEAAVGAAEAGAGSAEAGAQGRGSSNSGTALPLIAVLSALELGKCNEKGQDMVACATALAVATAGGLAAGQLVTVVAGAGIPVVSALATGLVSLGPAAGAAALVYATYDVSTRVADAIKKTETARSVTPQAMNEIVGAFQKRIGALPKPSSAAVDAEQTALAQLVAQARTAQSEFQQANGLSKLAASSCADPEKNPIGYASDAERRLREMQTLADATAKEVADARARVTPCQGADAARLAVEGYGRAQKAFQTLERTGNDANADITDAAKFFAVLKAARASKQTAGGGLAKLAQLADAADKVTERLRAALKKYNEDLAAFHAQSAGVFATFKSIQGEFPPQGFLPAHILAGFKTVDEALVKSTSGVLTADRLNAMTQQAGDDVTRLQGMQRLAAEQFEDLEKCGGMTDEMPEPLRRRLSEVAQGVSSTYKRGEQALAGGKDIAEKANACSAGPGGSGRLTGECTGSIDVTPASGPVGSPLRVTVTIQPPGDLRVTRVVAENPGCNAPGCREMRMTRLGQYTLALTLQAPQTPTASGGALGSFQLKVSAFEGDRAICRGDSTFVTVLAR